MERVHALEGLKVVEWTLAITGPWVGKCLGDHGAEVIKIESTINQDVTRLSVPYVGGIPHPDRSPTFLRFNTSKRSLTLNLKTSEGKEILKKLITWADVIFNNQRPGAMERLGLGYEEIRKLNPSIIAMDISNYGQTGPYAKAGGWGNMTMAMSGHTYLTRQPGKTPTAPGWLATADVIGPLNALVALLAAVDYRRRTGRGLYLDVSQLEPMVHFLGVGLLDYVVNNRVQQPIGNRDPYNAPHGVYPCKGDDQWCVLAITNEEEWNSLCKAIGNPEWTADPRFKTMGARKANEDELDDYLAEWTSRFSKQEVMELLQKTGVPAAAVQDIGDILDRDPQVRARKLYPRMEHPVMGRCYHGGWPFILSRTPTSMTTSPCLGADNEYVLNQLLGVGDERLIQLLEKGILE